MAIRAYVRSPQELSQEAMQKIEVFKGDNLDTPALHEAMGNVGIVAAAVDGDNEQYHIQHEGERLHSNSADRRAVAPVSCASFMR